MPIKPLYHLSQASRAPKAYFNLSILQSKSVQNGMLTLFFGASSICSLVSDCFQLLKVKDANLTLMTQVNTNLSSINLYIYLVVMSVS